MKNKFLYYILFLTLISFNSHADVCDEDNKVNIVSTLPAIHSLVLNIIQKVPNTKAELLLNGNISPHDYQLTPADMKKISDADIVFAISPYMETFIENPYQNENKCQNWVMFENSLKLATIREAGSWAQEEFHKENILKEHQNNENNHDKLQHEKEINSKPFDEDNHYHGRYDYHIWLSPKLMMEASKSILNSLVKADAENAHIYYENYNNLITKLKSTNEKIKKDIANKKIKFLVFHDAFQYFEKDYNLNAIGSITGSLNMSSAKLFTELQEKIKNDKINCIIHESQNKNAPEIAKKLNTKSISIDLLGARIKKNKDFYFNYINSITNSFKKCIN